VNSSTHSFNLSLLLAGGKPLDPSSLLDDVQFLEVTIAVRVRRLGVRVRVRLGVWVTVVMALLIPDHSQTLHTYLDTRSLSNPPHVS